MEHAFFVTGIGTDVGKTVASAVLQLILNADYWKPVQAGDLDFGDTERVQQYTGLPAERYHAPRYKLRTPTSPHYAARLDGEEIRLTDFARPQVRGGRPLIVEGAGGLLVPLNESETVADLIRQLSLPVLLVSRHYPGSINHTLLSIAAVRERGLRLAGLITIGDSSETVRIVSELTGISPILEIPEFDNGLPTAIQAFASAERRLRIREKLLSE